MIAPEKLSNEDLIQLIHIAKEQPIRSLSEVIDELGVILEPGEALTEAAICRKVYSIWYDDANSLLIVMTTDKVTGFGTSNPNSNYIARLGVDIAIQLFSRDGVTRAVRRDPAMAHGWGVACRIE